MANNVTTFQKLKVNDKYNSELSLPLKVKARKYDLLGKASGFLRCCAPITNIYECMVQIAVRPIYRSPVLTLI
jgi:hypothetical protein